MLEHVEAILNVAGDLLEYPGVRNQLLPLILNSSRFANGNGAHRQQ